MSDLRKSKQNWLRRRKLLKHQKLCCCKTLQYVKQRNRFRGTCKLTLIVPSCTWQIVQMVFLFSLLVLYVASRCYWLLSCRISLFAFLIQSNGPLVALLALYCSFFLLKTKCWSQQVILWVLLLLPHQQKRAKINIDINKIMWCEFSSLVFSWYNVHHVSVCRENVWKHLILAV